MKELFSDVYKPLLKENELQEQIIQRYESRAKQAQEEIQVLNSIIRLPRMCSEFHKVLQKKTIAENKMTEAKAVEQLKNRIKGENISVFMEGVLNNLDKRRRDISPQMKESIPKINDMFQ